jgi:type II secretory pathway pseudopilin PulG
MELRGEQGYALIALVVMVFLVMLALGMAAPRVAKELRRENEVEAMHRGDQYTRAIRVFYRKNGSHYPSSIEQLEKTNNVRYLRQRYFDPVTGKDDWRLIHLGEAKTTAKGYFGQPLAGIATSSVGSMQGLSTPGTPIGASSSAVGAGASGSPGSGFGQSPGSGFGSSSSAFGSSASPGFSSAAGASNTAAGATGGNTTGGNAAGGSASAGAGTQSSTSGSQPLGAGGPVIGVGTGASGDSIVELNEQTSYETWEFVYDPRIEQLYGKATLMGGAGTSAGGLGSGSGSSIAPNNPNGPSSNSPFGTSPTSPGTSPTSPGTSPNSPGSNSPFGNSPGSSPFGSSPTR